MRNHPAASSSISVALVVLAAGVFVPKSALAAGTAQFGVTQRLEADTVIRVDILDHTVETFEWELDSGPHLIAIRGWDTDGSLAGHVSALSVDDRLIHVTGDGSWRVVQGDPGGAWRSLDYSDDDWSLAMQCNDSSDWEEPEHPVFNTDAQWVWYHATGACDAAASFGEAAFRLVFHLP